MLSRRIGGPNDAYGLDHFGSYSYYAGPQSLSQPRDSPTGVATRLMQCNLARGNGLGVPGSTYNPSLAVVTAQKSAEIFRGATAEPAWVIMAYTSPATALGGMVTYEDRLNEYTAPPLCSVSLLRPRVSDTHSVHTTRASRGRCRCCTSFCSQRRRRGLSRWLSSTYSVQSAIAAREAARRPLRRSLQVPSRPSQGYVTWPALT